MLGLNIGDIASWLIAAGLGIGILWAANQGYIKTYYSLGNINIPMEKLGLIILLAAMLLGIVYFGLDLGRKL